MTAQGQVLIIDDDGDVLRAARLALMSRVAATELTSSVVDLEDRLASSRFDALLLDMNFVRGEHNGAAGLDALARARVSDPDLAVVLMTAYGSLSLAVDALKCGAVDFVLKPWRNDKLVAAVTAAVSITQSRRAVNSLDLDSLERAAIERALAQHRGNVSLAAATLGLSRPALYRRMMKHGL